MKLEGTTDVDKLLDLEAIDSEADKVVEKSNKENSEQNADAIDDILDIKDVKQTKAELGLNDNKHVIKAQRQHGLEPLTDRDRDIAEKLGLVPKNFRDAFFDVDRIKNNLKIAYDRSKGIRLTYNFSDYVELCDGIISTIRLGELPDRSYIIGAPNGFGKTSFANECIMTLNKNCYSAAPFVTLTELSSIRKYHAQSILKPFSYEEYKKRVNEDTKQKIDAEYLEYFENSPEYVLQLRKACSDKSKFIVYRYSYDDYINAACVFVRLTGAASKEIESYELKHLLTIRGMKGLPTIVLTGDSMNAYYTDEKLREIVWDEIIAYDRKTSLYDTLYHVSCYSYKTYGIARKDIIFEDESLGLVKGKRVDNNEYK